MNELALFAGGGGGILGGKLLGWRCVCAVEVNDYARRILVARQNDGSLPPFPIWDDVRTFDGRPWRGVVDIISGGFPCQDISCANPKGRGIHGERSGLWREMARIICEVRPRFVLVENSPMLVGRGLGLVLGDLAAMGYDARWGVVGAWHAGAPHKRDRLWLVAYPDSDGWQARLAQRGAISSIQPDTEPDGENRGQGWWSAEPDVGRVAHGVASRVDRLRALGNGQVPAALALAWSILAPEQPDCVAEEL